MLLEPKKRPLQFVALLFCLVLIITSISMGVRWITRPYTNRNAVRIPESGWLVTKPSREAQPGEVWYAQRVLTQSIPNAALMLFTNHQQMRVFLEDECLYASSFDPDHKNPGMAIHFVPLPDGYVGKTLRIELVSPYAVYAGRLSPVYIGDIPSLNAMAFGAVLPKILILAIMMGGGLLGMLTSIFLYIKNNTPLWNILLVSISSFIWGLYQITTTYVSYLLFPPPA